MTATNHVLTGVTVATFVHTPWLALPLALLSHFILDALPHFGADMHNTRNFLMFLGGDLGAASAVLLSLFILHPIHWPLMVMCGVLAASPDLVWLKPWLRELSKKPPQPQGPITRFHSKTQWGERKWGIVIELFYAVLMLTVLVKNLKF